MSSLAIWVINAPECCGQAGPCRQPDPAPITLAGPPAGERVAVIVCCGNTNPRDLALIPPARRPLRRVERPANLAWLPEAPHSLTVHGRRIKSAAASGRETWWTGGLRGFASPQLARHLARARAARGSEVAIVVVLPSRHQTKAESTLMPCSQAVAKSHRDLDCRSIADLNSSPFQRPSRLVTADDEAGRPCFRADEFE